MNWIIERAPLRKIPLYILATLAIKIVYAITAMAVILHFKPHVISKVLAKSVPIEGQHFTLGILMAFLATIIIEECVFRLPLASLISRGYSLQQVLLAALGLSVAFAYVHGGSFLVRLSIQGVGGMICSLLFIKCAGECGEKMRALLSVITVHVIFDVCIMAPSILSGKSDIRWEW